MINETNDSAKTILSTVSQEQIEHHNFLEELEKKNRYTNWHWKMLGVTVVVVILWMMITGWWFNSGGETGNQNGKHINNPYVSEREKAKDSKSKNRRRKNGKSWS